ncbi:MAG: HlyD family efflux transporter periplasmic adaptor subunit [Bacteroidales bacterium]|nr:HlyD family efflux transporter periplasmic adaptor subunit [Bacteroidales bacterium]
MISFKLEDLSTSRQVFETRISKAIPIFIGIIILIIVGFFVWASLAKMDDIVKAQALLRPVDSISSVCGLTNGKVEKKYYENDMYVEQGQVLLYMDVRSEELDLLNSRNYLTQVEGDIQENMVLQETILNNRNMADLKMDKTWIRSEAYITEYRRNQLLVEQAKIQSEREKSKPVSIRTEYDVVDTEAAYLRSLLSASSWRNEQLLQVSEKLKGLHQTYQSLEKHIASLERTIKNATVSAPIDGIINEIKNLNQGDIIIAGEEILRIIPNSSSGLKAELMIDPAYIALVKTGQTVNLRFPGLPPSDFGQLPCIVSMIPADVNVINSSLVVFVVEATIPDATLVSSRGEKILLRPGISSDARIIVDNDTVLRMILRRLDFLD